MNDRATFAGVRSYLFAPASEQRRLQNARDSDADAIIADLEDGVADDEKPRARELLEHHLAERRPHGLQLVRINALTTPHAKADLDVLDDLCVDGVVVPKVRADDLTALPSDGPPVVALVETAEGLRGAYSIASFPRVRAIMIGQVDLTAELGLTPSAGGHELLYARSSLVIDSAAAGLQGPIDGACTAVRNARLLRAEAEHAGALGFVAKACIHPAQVPIVHDVFTPSSEELAWASRIVEAAEVAQADGLGVVALEDQMVDAPVIARARRVLEAADTQVGREKRSGG